MRNHQLMSTFKSGKMSPRLLGRRDVDAVKNACLELDNMYVGLDGAVSSRNAFTEVYEIGNSEVFVANFDSNEYVISISNTVLFGVSGFIKICASTGIDVSSLIRYYGWSSFDTFEHIDFGSRWSNTTYSSGGAVVSTGLQTLTQNIIKGPYTQMVQLTDKTILLTGNNSCPMYITLYNNRFYVYPIFVSFIQYINNQVSRLSGGTQYIEIQPHTMAFAEENTIADAAHVIRIINQNLYTGTALTSSTRIKDGDLFLYDVLLPNNVGAPFWQISSSKLQGRVLRITNPDASESAYLLVKASTYSASGFLVMSAIRLIGGAMNISSTVHETTLWRMSSWGNTCYPKVCNQYKGRTFLANTSLQPDTMWAAAINVKDSFNLGIFSQTVLKQDASTSDSSGLKYYNSSVVEGLSYELGLADGEAEEIKWMASRRRIHAGTTNGEFQLTSNSAFTYANIEAVKIGSIRSEYIQPASGDRKLIYVDSAGYLRGISVEDKNYESEDINLSVGVGKLGLQKRITWGPKNSAAFYGNTVIVIEDTLKIFSASNFTIAGSSDLIVIGGKDFIYGKIRVGYTWYLIREVEQIKDTFSNLASCELARGTTLKLRQEIYDGWDFVGYEYSTVDVPSDWDGVTDLVPVGFQAYFDIKSRIKSFPIEDKYPFGDSVGVISRWDKATIQYISSGKFYVGSEDSNLLPVEGISDDDRVTGQVSLDFSNSPDRQNHIIIESVNPLTISGVALRGVVYGED